jgi:hypothetical protein
LLIIDDIDLGIDVIDGIDDVDDVDLDIDDIDLLDNGNLFNDF